MDALGRFSQTWWSWVLAASWQMALLVALIALVSALMVRLPARFRYAMWLLVLVKAFTPPSLAVPWSVGNWAIAPLLEQARAIALAPDRAVGTGRSESATILVPATRPVVSSPSLELGTSASALPPASFGSARAESADSPWGRPSFETILLCVWIAGLAAYGGFVAFQYVRMTRALRSAQEVEEGPLRVLLEGLSLRLGRGSAPELMLSDKVGSPLLFGLLRPRIVLPASFPGTLASEELENVLLHELAHWRRRDLWVGWLQVIAQGVLWFHPFLWFANARLRHERECACDEAVVGLTRGTPRRYGESLLKVVLAARARPAAALGFPGIFERGGGLQIRLEAIMNPNNRTHRFRFLGWTIVALFALAFLPMGLCSVGPKAAGAGEPPQAEKSESSKTTRDQEGKDWLAKLDESQRLYVEWTERQFHRFFDRRDFSVLTSSQYEEMESAWLFNLKGPKNREYYENINSLGAMRSRKAVAPFLEIVNDPGRKDCRDRWMAVRALGMIGDESVVPSLIHLVYYPNQNTRFWAQISLVRLTGQNFAADWQAWGKWWDAQGKKPKFSPEKVVWINADWCDQKTQAEQDQKFIDELRGRKAETAAKQNAGAEETTQAGEVSLSGATQTGGSGPDLVKGNDPDVKFLRPLRPDSRSERGCLEATVARDGQLAISPMRQWSDTGLEVKKGQSLVFKADGEVYGCQAPEDDWARGPWGPAGGPGDKPDVSSRVCALIGKIEDGGRSNEFFVGEALTLSVPFDGRLFLGVSDIFHHDNSGTFFVQLTCDGAPVDFRALQKTSSSDSPSESSRAAGSREAKSASSVSPGASNPSDSEPVEPAAVEMPEGCEILKYDDGRCDGKRSIGASGHAVAFEAPAAARFVEAVQIAASRYGMPQAHQEDFHLYILNEKKQVLADLKFPYGMIERTEEMNWYTLRTPSIEVPDRFLVALAFNPHQTKGVYLGFDSNVSQTHSFIGLPTEGYEPVKDKYDWMVRVALSEKPSGEKGVVKLADFKPPVSTNPFDGCTEVRNDSGESDDKQSYGGRGPAVRFDLSCADLPKSGASPAYDQLALRGFRLYAGRYGSGYDPEQTFVDVAILDSQDKVRWQGQFPYSLFSYKTRWVDLALPQPVALSELVNDDGVLSVAFNPRAHQTKGIYFHYSKNPKESHSSAGTVEREFQSVPDREWIIRAYIAKNANTVGK